MERIEIETEIATIEDDVLPGLKRSLSYNIAYSYEVSSSDDYSQVVKDIEFFEDEICRAEDRRDYLYRMLVKCLKRDEQSLYQRLRELSHKT